LSKVLRDKGRMVNLPRVSYVKILEAERILLFNGYLGFEKLNELSNKIRQVLSEYYRDYEGLVFQTVPGILTILSGKTTSSIEKEIYLVINQIAPHGVSFVSVSHERPFTTLLIASRMLTRKPGFTYIDGPLDKYVIGILDYSHELPQSDIASSVFISKKYCGEISKLSYKLGGIFLECGYSRSIILLDPLRIQDLKGYDFEVKIGVGEGDTPVKALINAERSLSLRGLIAS